VLIFDAHIRMKISSDDQKAIGLILLYLGLLFFLIGLAARLKESFHSRAEISSIGFTAAAIAAALGVIMILFSWRKKQG
jgi:hypothetical protein